MVFIQPEERVRNEKILHFVATVIENERTPIRLRSPPRIGVLVKMGAVKFSQPLRVAREMGRRPIQNNPEARGVAAIHKEFEIIRLAITAGRREIPDSLISPRAVEWMLHDRHQLKMREAQPFRVRD